VTTRGIMSDWLEMTALEYMLNGGSSPTIATLSGSGPWLALYTTNPSESGSGLGPGLIEITGVNYERVRLPNIFIEKEDETLGLPPPPPAYYKTYTNSASIIFPAAGDDNWGTITHIGITTSSFVDPSRTDVIQELLFYGALTSTITPLVTDTFRILEGELEIGLGGAYGSDFAIALLESSLNNTNTVINTTKCLALYDGLVEKTQFGYSRVYYSSPHDDYWNWSPFTSGSTSNKEDIYFDYALEDWGNVTHAAILGIVNNNSDGYDVEGGTDVPSPGYVDTLIYFSLGSGSKTIYYGDQLFFPSGSMKIKADDDIL